MGFLHKRDRKRGFVFWYPAALISLIFIERVIKTTTV